MQGVHVAAQAVDQRRALRRWHVHHQIGRAFGYHAHGRRLLDRAADAAVATREDGHVRGGQQFARLLLEHLTPQDDHQALVGPFVQHTGNARLGDHRGG